MSRASTRILAAEASTPALSASGKRARRLDLNAGASNEAISPARVKVASIAQVDVLALSSTPSRVVMAESSRADASSSSSAPMLMMPIDGRAGKGDGGGGGGGGGVRGDEGGEAGGEGSK